MVCPIGRTKPFFRPRLSTDRAAAQAPALECNRIAEARALENGVRTGVSRLKSIVRGVPDPVNQAILSAETWNRFADNAFLTAMKHSMFFGIFPPFWARAAISCRKSVVFNVADRCH